MLDHEYLPLDGMKAFTEAAAHLLLGKDSPAVTQNRVRGVRESGVYTCAIIYMLFSMASTSVQIIISACSTVPSRQYLALGP